MEDESDEAERREVEDEGRAPALFEEDEEADEQIDDADEVDVVIARRAIRDGLQVVQIDVITDRLAAGRGAFNDIVQWLTRIGRVLQILRDVGGRNDRLVVNFVGADRDEAVAGDEAEDAVTAGRRVRGDGESDDAFIRLLPGDAVGRGGGGASDAPRN